MNALRRLFLPFAFALLLCPILRAETTLKNLKKDVVLTAKELAKRIDAHVQARWQDEQIKPAPLADDAEFLRRLTLDLLGRIPDVSELHDFIDDKDSEKRAKRVDLFLKKQMFANHLASVWRETMIPQNNNRFAQAYAPQMETWLRRHFSENTGYDEMVRQLLTAQVRAGRQGGQRAYDSSVAAFYQANQLKPEEIAAATSRLFLGVKLECAQCHNHPFQIYTRTQFWEYTAFFAGIQPARRVNNRVLQVQDNAEIHEITIPDTERVVKARYLDGSKPKWDKKPINARETLATWMTAPNNPYFSKAAVNRIWEHFFGRGLVDPVDEMGEDNPGEFPELMEELASQFVRNDFDIRYLIRAITASKVYQLTSQRTHESQDDPAFFARMNLKGMSPEQLYSSLVIATRYRDNTMNRGQFQTGFNQFRFGTVAADIRSKFLNSADRRTEYQTSILQALTLMNGKFVTDATSLQRSGTLMSIVHAPFMNNAEKLEALSLAALSRKPTEREKTTLLKYIDKGGPTGDTAKALADVFWAYLNSSEFIFNH